MLDNQLIQLFRPLIQNGLISNGYPNVTVKQNYQPTQQGVNTGPTVYFNKISDRRYGFLKREDVYNTNTNQMVHTESQWYETTFQISALVIQDPKNISYTASDLVNIVAMIMQSDATRIALLNGGAGIYRITDVRNPYFLDDQDRWEASPSFDFTLTHEQVSSIIDPSTNSVVPGIYRV